MIELAFPYALLLLPAPVLVWWLVPPHRKRMSGVRVPFFRRIAAALGEDPRLGSVVLRRRWFEMLIALLVWIALIVALARPERVGEPVEITKAARDIVLAIDISGSMDETDFVAQDGTTVQRLEGVKRVVGRFIEAREGDRVALIVFGEKAFVQSPFTEDLRTVRELLEQTEVGMAGPHTVIGDAIGLAIRIFETSEIEERLLIVLSDGADTGSRMSPANAAEIAASNGVEIFTVGVGDPEGKGDQKIDVRALEDISARAGGRFFFAGDEAGLAGVYERIDEMSPRKIETISFRPREALGSSPLAAATLLGLLGASVLHLHSLRRASA
ncbi:MAG: VWA domain-containing protein [Deltaproteobacteria bacterium]|nr:VWA domain-containing protein [Deltaproteobacteria bacterium]MBW2387287.1 VWA domain-containing protein [Deltaproteobacteria bacterium]MBW2723230.1 VWA domain-containing protein [Deltaproteobacteria bacterium]